MLRTTQAVFQQLTFQFKNSFSTANPLNAQLLLNSIRNSIRFENQNRNWTFQELEDHSNAFGYGLIEMGYQPGDKLLLWVEKSQTSEVVATQIGAAKAGVVIVPIVANSDSELESSIASSNCTGILLSPNSKLGETKYIDVINKVVPELKSLSRGQSLKSQKYPKLKYVVHAGFYSYPGTYKFRETLVYASKNFNTLKFPQFNASLPFIQDGNTTYSLADCVTKLEQIKKQKNISKDDNIIISGDAKNPLSFALGALNSALHGNFTVYTGNYNVQDVCNVVKHYKNSFLLLDSDLAQNQQKIDIDDSTINNIKSIGLNDRGNGQSSNLNSIFQGKSAEVLHL